MPSTEIRTTCRLSEAEPARGVRNRAKPSTAINRFMSLSTQRMQYQIESYSANRLAPR